MPKPALANWEIAVYALYLLGGGEKKIGTEEIALKCFELARDTFSWVRFPDIPDKDVARSALMDARKPKHGELVTGRAGRGRGRIASKGSDEGADGWQLSKSGTQWLLENLERLSDSLGGSGRELKAHRQERLLKLARLKEGRLYAQFLSAGEAFTPSLGEMAEMLRCRVDSDSKTWERRISLLTNLATEAGDLSVLRFLEKCLESYHSQALTP